MNRIVLFTLIIGILGYGCGCGSSTQNKNKDIFAEIVQDGSELDTIIDTNESSIETLQILQNISSSPVEMAALLQATGVPFNENYITSIDGIDRYNTDFKRALNLGIFGADLGYLNMYKKTGPVMTNMRAIRKLSEELRVQQFFDFNTIRRLATNNENLDSLMYISVSSFNNMDAHLQKTGRSEISALIICGTWLEGMYIATQVVKNARDNEEVIERIGEQKTIVENLVEILSSYRKKKQFDDMYIQYKRILDSFDGITKTIVQGEPEEIEMDGMLIYVQNETSFVDVPKETLDSIIEVIESVRNEIIHL
ncbi:MAG: hypothetical protein PHU27_09940 [Salinivirgaceae bacterium]|nr:hypothetical protein [Salinivirgaceae bacterium]MDD4747549.1 hypothetical protein [Salinivirgaceae bacterium]MDY0279443.1 hypothetical protein [Salinivirgaceae bacterium]